MKRFFDTDTNTRTVQAMTLLFLAAALTFTVVGSIVALYQAFARFS